MHLTVSQVPTQQSLLEELQAQHGAEISSLLIHSTASRAQAAISACDEFLDLGIAPTHASSGVPPVLVFTSMRWDRDITYELHRLFARYVAAGHVDIFSPMPAEKVGSSNIHPTNPRCNLPMRFAIFTNNVDAVTALASHRAPHKHPAINPEAADDLLAYIDEAYADHPAIAKRIKAAALAGQQQGPAEQNAAARKCNVSVLGPMLGKRHMSHLEWLMAQTAAEADSAEVLFAIRRCFEYVDFGIRAHVDDADSASSTVRQFIENAWPTRYRDLCASLLQRHIDTGAVSLDQAVAPSAAGASALLPLDYAIQRGNGDALTTFVANDAPHASTSDADEPHQALIAHIERSQKGKWWPKELLVDAALRGLALRQSAIGRRAA